MLTQLVPKILQVLFAEPTFEKRARVNAGRSVALEIYEVPGAPVVVGAAEEMIESDFEQSRERRVGRQMSADIGVVLVGAHHHGDGVPANQALDAAFDRA